VLFAKVSAFFLHFSILFSKLIRRCVVKFGKTLNKIVSGIIFFKILLEKKCQNFSEKFLKVII